MALTDEHPVTVRYEGSPDPCDEFVWSLPPLIRDQITTGAGQDGDLSVPECLLVTVNQAARRVYRGWPKDNYRFACWISDPAYPRDGLDLTRQQRWTDALVARAWRAFNELGDEAAGPQHSGDHHQGDETR